MGLCFHVKAVSVFIECVRSSTSCWRHIRIRLKSKHFLNSFLNRPLFFLSFSSELEKTWSSSAHISQLPTEIMLRLFHYLSPEDLCRCSQVCSSWSELAKTGSLWRHLFPVRWARGESLITAVSRVSCNDVMLINVACQM